VCDCVPPFLMTACAQRIRTPHQKKGGQVEGRTSKRINLIESANSVSGLSLPAFSTPLYVVVLLTEDLAVFSTGKGSNS
jgi:hypothetical protein